MYPYLRGLLEKQKWFSTPLYLHLFFRRSYLHLQRPLYLHLRLSKSEERFTPLRASVLPSSSELSLSAWSTHLRLSENGNLDLRNSRYRHLCVLLEKRLNYWDPLYPHLRLLSKSEFTNLGVTYIYGDLFILSLCIHVFGKVKVIFNTSLDNRRKAIYNSISHLSSSSSLSREKLFTPPSTASLSQSTSLEKWRAV